MKKINTIRLILPQILLTVICIIYLFISQILFYVKVKSIAYGLDSLKVDPITGMVTPNPNVILGLNLFMKYQYFNYVVLLFFVLLCFLRYAIIRKKVFNKKVYVVINCICTVVIALFNIVL